MAVVKPRKKLTRKKLVRVNSDGKGKGALSRPAQPSGVDEDKLRKLAPPGLATAFVKSKLHDKALAVAGLGEPSDWEGDMPELPNDIAAVDHDDLANLLAQFTNAYSTATWNASKNYVEADAYESIVEYLEDQALLEAGGSNEGQRKANARTDDAVVAARGLQRSSYHNYVRFRDLAKTLYERSRAVSRIGGFVSDEAEIEDSRASKPASRGRAVGKDRGTSKGAGRPRSRR